LNNTAEETLMINEFKLEEHKENILKSGIVSLDIEFNPDASPHQKDFREHFWGNGLSYWKGDEVISFWITDKEVIQETLDFLVENHIEIVAHYAQSDIVGYLGAGFTFKEDPIIKCTCIAYNFIYDEWDDKDLGLKTLSKVFLGKDRADFQESQSYGKDSPEFIQYAREDVEDQLRLYKMAEAKLKQLDLYDTYTIVSNSVMPFADMISAGIPFDPDAAEDLYHKFCILQEEVEENIYKIIGRVDLNSPKQMQNRLFKELRYTAKGLATNKTGYSTGAENIEKLAVKYPACELLSANRSCEKAVSTYLEPFLIQYEELGRVYDFFFLNSKTGRTRSKRIQLIPNEMGKNIRHNETLKAAFNDLILRRMFKAGKGKKLVVRDYASLEYRTSAIAANDAVMIELYQSYECKCGCKGKSSKYVEKCPECGTPEGKKTGFTQGKDLHQFVCDVANSVGAGINRQKAKNVSFCTIFYGTAFRLSQMLGLPVDLCEKIQNSLLSRFQGIRNWHKQAERIVDTTGEVRCFMGRRRKVNLKERLANGKEENAKWIRKGAVNELINIGAQAPGCIIGQIAMQNFRKRMINKGWWKTKANIIIFCHDEIIVECDEDIAEEINEILKYEMVKAVECEVPFSTEGGVFNSWDEAK